MIHSPGLAWAMGYPPHEHLFGDLYLGIWQFCHHYSHFGDQWIGRTFMGHFRGDEEGYE